MLPNAKAEIVLLVHICRISHFVSLVSSVAIISDFTVADHSHYVLQLANHGVREGDSNVE